jgi:hypothetical protein
MTNLTQHRDSAINIEATETAADLAWGAMKDYIYTRLNGLSAAIVRDEAEDMILARAGQDAETAINEVALALCRAHGMDFAAIDML